MNTVDDVIHFFEMEIEQARSRKNKYPVFNGVNVGIAQANQMIDKHIWYCQNIIDRIKRGKL